MRRFVLTLAFLGVGLLSAGSAAAQEAKKPEKAMAAPAGEAVELTATVVDLSCKIVNGAGGADHTMCAQVCADKGQPLGLLTSDGKFYVPVNAGMGADGENARLKPFAEQTVKVSGKLIKRAGVNAVVIEKVSKT